jgi:hypothetical protein
VGGVGRGGGGGFLGFRPNRLTGRRRGGSGGRGSEFFFSSMHASYQATRPHPPYRLNDGLSKILASAGSIARRPPWQGKTDCITGCSVRPSICVVMLPDFVPELCFCQHGREDVDAGDQGKNPSP